MTKIGISPRLLHPQPGAHGVFTKLLHYVEDGWTVVTADGARAVHWEHSVAITEDGPRVLTLP